MSEAIVAKLLDYGLAGLILLYLGRKLDAIESVLRELCSRVR